MKTLSFFACCILLYFLVVSFKDDNLKWAFFSYPTKQNSTIGIQLHRFDKFIEGWRGTDYFYESSSIDSIYCSVLFYKLTLKEQEKYNDVFCDILNEQNDNTSSASNSTQFTNSTKQEFLIKQADVTNIEGLKIPQKHMYAIGYLDKELYTIVHVYKSHATKKDSLLMYQIVNSVGRVK